jgi:hypothetical protein
MRHAMMQPETIGKLMHAMFRGLLLAGLCLGTSVLPAGAACMVGAVATVPLTVSGPRLYVPLSINETEGLFLLDTGAGDTILNAGFAQRAHVGMDRHAPQKIYSGGGGRETLRVNQAHARHIEFGKLSFQDWLFSVVPPDSAAMSDSEHDGLLGMDFLHYFDIDVDLAGHQVTLWRVTGCTDIHPEWQGDYDAIPLKHTSAQNITLPIFIDNEFLDVTLDTGAVGLLLSRGAGARAGATDAMLTHDKPAGGAGIGGAFPAVVHRFGLLLVGKAEWDHPDIVVETQEQRPWYGDGLMNWRVLKARRFWISYATSTLFVQEAPKK